MTDQRHIKVTLEHEIVRNRIAHAYLFVGPRGVGKTTAARLLAKSVNCTDRKSDSAEPCNACAACERMIAGQSFDIIEIDAASHTGVDHVREYILESVEVSAGHGRYRVFIIDEVHMLSTAAFNAMLKVLEEPPEHVIFILATTEVHKVPATIISRCQRFDFKRIPADAIRERLRMMSASEGVQVDEVVLVAVAEHADGSLRDAESMLGQIHALGLANITMDEASLVLPHSDTGEAASLIGQCIDRNAAEALRSVTRLVEEGIALPVFMNDCMTWLRALLLVSVAKRLDDYTDSSVGERRELLLAQAERVNVGRQCRMIDIFAARRKAMADFPLPQIALELAVIEACGDDTPATTEAKKVFFGTPGRKDEGGSIENSSPKSSWSTPLRPAVPVSRHVAKTAQKSILEAKAAGGEGPDGSARLTLAAEDIMARWSEILEKVKTVNHSLSFVLTSATPLSLEEGLLKIGVLYLFHRDRLVEPKNRALLSEIATSILGGQVSIEPILSSALPETAPA